MKKYIIITCSILVTASQSTTGMDSGDQSFIEDNQQMMNDRIPDYQTDGNQSGDVNGSYDSESNTPDPREAELAKKNYVKSIVDGILRLKNEEIPETSGGKRIKSDKRTIKILDRIQSDLKELNSYLSNGLSESKGRSKNIDSTEEEEEKKIPRHEKKKNKSRRATRSRTKKAVTANSYRNEKSFYTVKKSKKGRFRKYIPANPFIGRDQKSYEEYKSRLLRTSAAKRNSSNTGYIVKNWGTGTRLPMEEIPYHPTNKKREKYFSRHKPSCHSDRCG